MNSESTRITSKIDGRRMILVPGTSFQMGSDEGPEKHAPQHTVHLAPFYIDCFPVTNQEYKRYLDATGRPAPHFDVSWCDTRGYNWDPETRSYPEGKADHPVVLVTWEDALAFAQWAGKRLPTEAEWELAARGTDGRLWPWGNTAAAGRSNTSEAGMGGTTPVSQFTPDGNSPAGASDLIGNVWEWTSSLFRPYPYDACDGRENLKMRNWRVLRGGSWVNDLYAARCYTRLDGDFVFYNNVGFRCAAPITALGDLRSD